MQCSPQSNEPALICLSKSLPLGRWRSSNLKKELRTTFDFLHCGRYLWVKINIVTRKGGHRSLWPGNHQSQCIYSVRAYMPGEVVASWSLVRGQLLVTVVFGHTYHWINKESEFKPVPFCGVQHSEKVPPLYSGPCAIIRWTLCSVCDSVLCVWLCALCVTLCSVCDSVLCVWLCALCVTLCSVCDSVLSVWLCALCVTQCSVCDSVLLQKCTVMV